LPAAEGTGPVTRILVVRLGALGDIVHALPAFAACRRTWPSARIDWLVEARHRHVLAHVRGIDHVIVADTAGRWPELPGVMRAVRAARYDLAVDFQGLIKSAVLARWSGAARVAGFDRAALRERFAALAYSETHPADDRAHVIRKNLALAAAIGADASRIEFPLEFREPDAGAAPYAVLNPGAGWPNKRWPPERFGALAAWLATSHGLRSRVLWGPVERPLADAIVDRSGGAAEAAPPTGIGDVLTLARGARVFVSGDTGPLHLAAAVGAPIVGLYGPTSSARNGPFDPADVCVSRFDSCVCHHERRCRRPVACIDEIALAEVQDAVTRRLA
jgi:lipopolysaccharide heptosyltransferase I